MSKQKAARLMSMSELEAAIYRSRRNQRPYWQHLSHEEWVTFCQRMASWFTKQAPDEWDKYVINNNARKAESDRKALEKKRNSA